MLSTRVRLQSQVLSREENGSCRKYIQTFQMKILHWNKKSGCLRLGNSGRESRNMCKKKKQKKALREAHPDTDSKRTVKQPDAETDIPICLRIKKENIKVSNVPTRIH